METTKISQIFIDETINTYDINDLNMKVNENKYFTDNNYPYLNEDKDSLENEKWKNILELDNCEISNMGRIKINGEIVKQFTDENFNMQVKGFSDVLEPIHRLVARYWLKDIDGKNIVHHINNDHLDNRVENLIWLTNIEHGKIKHSKSNES